MRHVRTFASPKPRPAMPRFSFALPFVLFAATAAAAVFQGNGLKIGEVTADSAVIWTRLTARPEAN